MGDVASAKAEYDIKLYSKKKMEIGKEKGGKKYRDLKEQSIGNHAVTEQNLYLAKLGASCISTATS